jgi:hypothetical protein
VEVRVDDSTKEIVIQQLRAITNQKFNAIRKLSISDIDFNPFLLMSLGLNTPREIAEFVVRQRLERSLVTSFGQRIQNVAMAITERGTGVEGADICKEKNGIRYYIQMKTGPKTVNKDIMEQISTLLVSAARRNRGSVPLLGMTYGNSEMVSSIVRKYSQVDWIIGREFWSFISEDEGSAKEIFNLIRELDTEGDDTDIAFSEYLDQKISELSEQIIDKYGDGEDMWEQLFEDNM